MKFSLGGQKVNAVAVTEQLIKSLGVSVNTQTIERNILDHPEFPSILSISDSLTEWGIVNFTHRINKDQYQNGELLFPFIAVLNNDNGNQFTLIKRIDQGVVYTDQGNIEEGEFLRKWLGIALNAKIDQNSGEDDYKKNQIKFFLKNLRGPAALVILTLIIYLSLEAKPVNVLLLSLFVVKISGIFLTVLLLIQSLNANNPFIRNLCSIGGKDGCNVLLESEAAKLTSWLNWSEVGFFYFSGSFVYLILNHSSLVHLTWLNILALPYTVYSISYQYRQKNWCVLCCCVQLVLIIEALILNMQIRNYSVLISIDDFFLIVVCFGSSILIWSFLKPFFVASRQIRPIKKQLNKFKYDPLLFNQALSTQPYQPITENLRPIVLGNPGALIQVTLVSNLFCYACGEAHKSIERLLKYRNDVKVNIIFATSAQKTDPRKKLAMLFNSMNNSKHDKTISDALNEWFNSTEKNYEKFIKKYHNFLNYSEIETVDKHREWCLTSKIEVTPTIFVNGRKLPKIYSWDDLKYLLN